MKLQAHSLWIDSVLEGDKGGVHESSAIPHTPDFLSACAMSAGILAAMVMRENYVALASASDHADVYPAQPCCDRGATGRF
jgi:hypothetical protein